MAVIDNSPSRYEEFTSNLAEFPFVRLAIFSAIASIVFQILNIGFFSNVLSGVFSTIGYMAIVARVFSIILCWFEHKLSIICMMSLFTSAECFVVIKKLESFVLEIENETLGKIGIGAYGILGVIAELALVLAALTFLIRIFLALFVDM